MRNSTRLMLVYLLVLMVQIGHAQFLQPVEKKINIDEKVTPAWVLAVSADKEALAESIIDYTKEEVGVKLKKGKNGLLMAKEIKVPSTTIYTGDLKVLLSTVSNQTQVAVAFMPGYDIALNSEDYPNEMERLRQYTRKMVKYHMVSVLQEKIEEDEGRLRDLETSLKKNRREYQKLDKRTSKMQKKMGSDKTEEHEKFELENGHTAAVNRMSTLTEARGELEEEIAKMNEKVQVSQEEINDIENQFVERKATVRTEEVESEEEKYKP